MILSENFCTGPRRAADAARTAAPGPLAAVASDPPRAGCRARPGRRTELAADGEQDRWRACRQRWHVSCRGEPPRRPLVLDTSPRPHLRTHLRSRASTAASPVGRPGLAAASGHHSGAVAELARRVQAGFPAASSRAAIGHAQRWLIWTSSLTLVLGGLPSRFGREHSTSGTQSRSVTIAGRGRAISAVRRGSRA
jgi:hypothetical protein